LAGASSQPGGFAASAETGELWIEYTDDLLKLREEAEAVIGKTPLATP